MRGPRRAYSESEDSGMHAARPDGHHRVDEGSESALRHAPRDGYMSAWVRPPYLPFPYRSHVAVTHKTEACSNMTSGETLCHQYIDFQLLSDMLAGWLLAV